MCNLQYLKPFLTPHCLFLLKEYLHTVEYKESIAKIPKNIKDKDLLKFPKKHNFKSFMTSNDDDIITEIYRTDLYKSISLFIDEELIWNKVWNSTIPPFTDIQTLKMYNSYKNEKLPCDEIKCSLDYSFLFDI
jgi:hypothetical protein